LGEGAEDTKNGAGRVAYDRLKLPSDRITLGQMRLQEPNLFTRENPNGILDAEGISLQRIEQELAEWAFAAAAGRSPEPIDDRPEVIEILTRGYQRYGLSSGMNQARELVRQLEAEAAQQGARIAGKSR
jgi:hypothetical protein